MSDLKWQSVALPSTYVARGEQTNLLYVTIKGSSLIAEGASYVKSGEWYGLVIESEGHTLPDMAEAYANRTDEMRAQHGTTRREVLIRMNNIADVNETIETADDLLAEIAAAETSDDYETVRSAYLSVRNALAAYDGTNAEYDVSVDEINRRARLGRAETTLLRRCSGIRAEQAAQARRAEMDQYLADTAALAAGCELEDRIVAEWQDEQPAAANHSAATPTHAPAQTADYRAQWEARDLAAANEIHINYHAAENGKQGYTEMARVVGEKARVIEVNEPIPTSPEPVAPLPAPSPGTLIGPYLLIGSTLYDPLTLAKISSQRSPLAARSRALATSRP